MPALYVEPEWMEDPMEDPSKEEFPFNVIAGFIMLVVIVFLLL